MRQSASAIRHRFRYIKEAYVQSTNSIPVGSGLPQLDSLLQGLRLGDNVVWQLADLADYEYFAQALVDYAIGAGADCVYIRFAPQPPVLSPQPGLTVVNVDPSNGFDAFSGEIYRVIEDRGKGVFYVFDNLSSLVEEWATDEMLANFFQITCPHLYDLDTIAYFALRRGQHMHSMVSRIRSVTQILIDVYQVSGSKYIHPIKVWERYSPQMFMPNRMDTDSWEPVSRSGEAATVLNSAKRYPITLNTSSIAPWDSVYRRLMRHYEGSDKSPESMREAGLLKEELVRMMFGNHKKLLQLAGTYMTLESLFQIRDRIIGSGRIGGKSAGMLVARSILAAESGDVDFINLLEEHDSFYIGSDVFFTFLVNNDLFRLRMDLSRKGSISWDEFENVERKFLEGSFPPDVLEQFRNLIDYYGQAPIIVRSSSLLEDGFNDAFAGKYRSEFCANQGDPENRLAEFVKAVKLVYASALNPDALIYRHQRGLDEGDEQMAILVQRVSGMPYKNYFFPSLAGVAFSKNLYAWTDRIDAEKGMIRLVFGLGTRAVNRVSGDYPRMIAVSHPGLRPEVGMEVAKYAQRWVDLLNLARNSFESILFCEVIADNNYPNLQLITSEVADRYLREFTSPKSVSSPKDLVLTFNNIINKTRLVAILGEILATLEKVWGQPIDIEFTAYVGDEGEVRVNLLQCRSLHVPKATGADIKLPERLQAERILFQSDRTISAGLVDDICYIIYIDPKLYAAAPVEVKRSLGRVVGKLNECLAQKKGRMIAVGPGRWGSTNIDLGVNVTYAEIANISVLVEVGREEAGLKPELSYGTHFFQDLVEADMLYVPVYPGYKGSAFNDDFFDRSPNKLKVLLPQFSEFAGVVRVIDVVEAHGAPARLIADPNTRNAVCFLDDVKGDEIQKKMNIKKKLRRSNMKSADRRSRK